MKKLLFVTVILLVLASCSNSVDIVAQEKCSESSKGFFSDYEQDYGKDTFFFTNHYNQKLNKCFILITEDNSPYDFHRILFDVYENKEWGGVHTAGQMAGLCGVKEGDSYKTCEHLAKDGGAMDSIKEFDDMIKQYMEK